MPVRPRAASSSCPSETPLCGLVTTGVSFRLAKGSIGETAVRHNPATRFL
jgi:hypothetical protein